MGNFAENLNLGKRVLPPPVIFGTDRCTTFVTFYLQKVEAPKDNSGLFFWILIAHYVQIWRFFSSFICIFRK